MKTVENLAELRSERSLLPGPVGLVPTMGYLHEGHLSLVRAAKGNCASVVVTIFVNPTQFSPNEDLDSYPRDLQHDLQMLEKESADLVWIPKPVIIYPPDFQTWVTVEEIAKPLEGLFRPGHFRGVTTVVAKLFNAVQPQKAYFGQKDAQQAAVIRQMVQDLNFNLEVVICPTVREPDGLAMSSRNMFLNPAERQAATVLYLALTTAADAFARGERKARVLRQIMSEMVQRDPLARLQYVSCAHPDTLEEIEGQITGRSLLSMAVLLGKTRLIDNLIIGE